MLKRTGDILVQNKQDMEDPYAQYAAKEEKPEADPYAQYAEKQPSQLEQIQKQHPLLYALSEKIAQHPRLSKALQASQYATNPIIQGTQQLGLPIAAEHMLAGPRKVAELLTGYEPHASTEGVNPYVAQGAKGAGEALGLIGGGLTGKSLAALRPISNAEKLAQAMEEYQQHLQRLNEQKAMGSHQFGSAKPERLELMGQDRAAKLQEAMQRHNELGQLQPGPMQPSDMIGQNAQQAVEQTQQAIRDFGAEGTNYPAKLQEAFMTELRGPKNPETGYRENGYMQAIGNRYTTLSNKLRGDEVTINKTPDVKQVAEWMDKEYSGLPAELKDKAIDEWVKQSSKSEKVNAADFLLSYRGLKHKISEAKEKAYSPNQDPETSEMWKQKAKTMKQALIKMGNVMNEQLGGQYLGELKSIDKQYATEIAPLPQNPIYQAMLKGKMPSNTLQELSMDYPGNATLRKIFAQRPELQRLSFGQQFAAKPEKLLRPNELTEQLGAQNPRVHQLIEEQYRAQQRLEPQKQLAKQQVEYEKLNEDVPRLQKELEDLDKFSSEIKEAMNAKSVSKQKMDMLKAKDVKTKQRTANIKKALGIHYYLKLFKPL